MINLYPFLIILFTLSSCHPMSAPTNEATVARFAKEHLESAYQRSFTIERTKWQCHSGNDCPDIHNVYAVAEDEEDMQVILTVDFRDTPPSVTRDTYNNEVENLKATRHLEQAMQGDGYYLKASVTDPAKSSPPITFGLKLAITKEGDAGDKLARQIFSEAIKYASANGYDALNINADFYRGVPADVTKKELGISSFNESETTYQSDNKGKLWALRTGGEELASPDSLLQNLDSRIRVVE